jgi:malic enzyme
LAGILAALKARGLQQEQLAEERIVCVGAGSAGVGVCEGIIDCMVAQGRVRTREEAYSKIWMLDQHGLLGNAALSSNDSGLNAQGPERPVKLDERQRNYAKLDLPDRLSLEEVVERVKPTVLLGLTGVSGAFTEKSIRTMAQHTEKPVVFPLSNPDTHAECSAENGECFRERKTVF